MTVRALCASALTVVAALQGCSTARVETVGASEDEIKATAQLALDDLRARFAMKVVEDTSPIDDTPIVRKRAVLIPSTVDRFDVDGAQLTPHATEPSAKPAVTTLPTSTSGSNKVQDSTGIGVEYKLSGLTAAPAATLEGYAIYPNAINGGHYLVRPSASGVEDFVDLESAPSSPSIAYEVTLGSKVAGLRLVANTLEFLDPRGTPRLRVAPPFVVDSTDAVSNATLSVEGCAVDSSSSPPWGRVPTNPGSTKCTVRVAWSPSVTYPLLVDPSWTSTGSMAEAHTEHTGTLLQDGKTLVVGGYNASSANAGAELYDPASGTWSTTGSPTTKRRYHVAALLQNGKVLIAGGVGTNTLATAELYTEATGTWSATGSLVDTNNKKGTAHTLPSGKVILVAGEIDTATHDFTAHAELYDPTAGTWALTGSLATARCFHASTLLPNGKVLASGGETTFGSTTATATAEIYDPSVGTWSGAAAMGVARYSHTVTALTFNGQAFAAGGYASGTSNPMSSTEIYTSGTNVWATGPNMNSARAMHRAFVLPDSQLLIAGGYVNSAGTLTASSDLYDQANNVLGATAAMPQGAASFSLTSDGSVGTSKTLGAGGWGSGGAGTTSAWLYDIGGTVNSGTPAGESGSAPVVFTTWDAPDTIGTFTASSTSLTATVQNNDSVTRNLYVDLMAIGLDERTIVRSQYFTLALAAHTSQVVTVPATAFPIRPVGTDAQLELQVRPYTTIGGPTGEVYGVNSPIYYEFSSDYSQVILHGQIGKDLDRTQPSTSGTQAAWLTSTSSMRSGLGSVTGTVYQSTGFVNVSTLTPPSSGQLGAYNVRGVWASDFDALYSTFAADITFPSGTWYRVCPHWTVEYDDALKGEDRLAVSGLWSPPAPYVHYIVSQGSHIVAKGSVLSTGCSAPIQMNNGTYELFWTSKLSRDDISTTVSVSPGHGGYNCDLKKNPNGCLTVDAMETFVRSFVVSGGGTQQLPVNLAYAASSEDFITRAAAVVGLILDPTGDYGVLSSHDYKVHADTGCASLLDRNGVPGGACYDDSDHALELGPDLVYALDGTSTATGRHTSFNKFVVAHEFGHNIQYTTWGSLHYGYECDGPNNTICQDKTFGTPQCRCEHVTTGNRVHCLQSRQGQPFAEQEGFAHFFASNLLNVATESDCTFVYYKDYLEADGGRTPPPKPVSCFYNSGSPQLWMHTNCSANDAQKGVEWDWLTFYYELHNKSANPYTFVDLQHIYQQACVGNNTALCTGGFVGNVFFDEFAFGDGGVGNPDPHSDLSDAANALFPGPKATYCLVTGQKHGVNTQ